MSVISFPEKVKARLPEGILPEDVHFFKCAAFAQPVETLVDEEKTIMASFKTSEHDQIGSNGKPTIMRVVAWMAHEGVNDNRQGFVKEELETAAKGLFKAPNFGVMDFNHSAVKYYTEEPKVIGLWYKAEFAYDTKAKKWGILATGMMWSWLFPEHADTLLADQARHGYMRFSMAAVSKSREFVENDGKPYEILHNPIFFTVSALDVPPADPAAHGSGTEDPEIADKELQQQLMEVANRLPWQTADASMESPYKNVTDKPLNLQQMTEFVTKIVQDLQTNQQGDRMEDNKETLQELLDRVVAAEKALAEATAAHATEKAELEGKVTDLTSQLEAANLKVQEVASVRDGVVAEKDSLQTRVTELETTVAELTAKLATFEEAQAKEEQSVVLAARLASLPKSVREAHEKKSEATRTRIETKWLAMKDEEWTEYRDEELLGYAFASSHKSYLERSREQGDLPNLETSGEGSDIAARVRAQLR